jgi:glucose dehydrogenase
MSELRTESAAFTAGTGAQPRKIAADVDKRIDARQGWVPTGVVVFSQPGRTIRILIKAKDPTQTWIASPNSGPFNAAGMLGTQGKRGYACAECTEAALVAKMGQGGRPIGVGLFGRVDIVPGTEGELLLACNDDLENIHGPGTADNSGAIDVVISVVEDA